jgi:hypothetical protein
MKGENFYILRRSKTSVGIRKIQIENSEKPKLYYCVVPLNVNQKAKKVRRLSGLLNPDPYIVFCVDYSTQIAWYIT